MDTRPTLLLCPSCMIPGWEQKFVENLEANHPFTIRMYTTLGNDERVLQKDDEIFETAPPAGVDEAYWHNCRIVFCSLEAWTPKHPPGPKYNYDRNKKEFLLMGKPDRNESEILTDCFARGIFDEGYTLKGGELFDRAASVIELCCLYKQIYSATLVLNRLGDFGGIADLLEGEASRAAWDTMKSKGISCFDIDTPEAKLARHTKAAYQEDIAPLLRAHRKNNIQQNILDAARLISKVLEGNCLRRLPLSRIPAAVDVHKMWTGEKNPKGIIGVDMKDVFYHTIMVEYSAEDYDTFEKEALTMHSDLYRDWMPKRDGEGMIPQDSRMLRNLLLLSNSLYFARPLAAGSPDRIPIPSSSHIRVSKIRKEIKRHQNIIKKLLVQCESADDDDEVWTVLAYRRSAIELYREDLLTESQKEFEEESFEDLQQIFTGQVLGSDKPREGVYSYDADIDSDGDPDEDRYQNLGMERNKQFLELDVARRKQRELKTLCADIEMGMEDNCWYHRDTA